MGLLDYLKYRVWDILLCAAASAALSFTLFSGFYAAQPLQAMPWPIAVFCTILTFVLFLAAYSYSTAIIGGIAITLVCLGVLICCAVINPAETIFDDVSGNLLIPSLILELTTVATFLLSRKKTGAIVLLATSICACAVIEYLYWYGHVVSFIVCTASCAALVAYRNYFNGLANSDSEALAFGTVSITSVLMALVTLTAGSLIFVVLIAPLNPPNAIVKLITENVRIEEEQVRGTGSAVNVENPDLLSMNTSEQTDSNGDTTIDESSREQMDNTSQQQEKKDTPNEGSALNLDKRLDKEAGTAVNTGTPQWAFVAVPIFIFLLIFGVIYGRKLLRRKRYKQMLQLDSGEQIEALFVFFMRRFKKIGMPTPGAQTLREYVASANGNFCHFESVTSNPCFPKLIAIYEAWKYGCAVPTQDDLIAFHEFYSHFYKCTCNFVGRVKYIPLFFRI